MWHFIENKLKAQPMEQRMCVFFKGLELKGEGYHELKIKSLKEKKKKEPESRVDNYWKLIWPLQNKKIRAEQH